MTPQSNEPASPAAGVLCCGNICFDTLVRPVGALRWNASEWVEAIETSIGGNGANTCAAIAMFGVRARLLSAVGDDEFGERSLARLRAAGVDLTHVHTVSGSTSATVVLIRADGDRMFLHHPGVMAEAFEEPFDFASGLADGCTRFHLANAFALPRLRRHWAETVRKAREAGLAVSMDTGWDSSGRWLEDLGPALPYTDLLFVNEEEALRLSGCASFDAAAALLRELGAAAVVVKRGPSGCAVFDRSGQLNVPAFDVPGIDSTGAGDCFAGAFLASLCRGLSHAEAAHMANAAGALTVQSIGAMTGLLSWNETVEWMKRTPRRGS